MEQDIKREFIKSIVLFAILISAIVSYVLINSRYESKFKEEFMLPGPSSEGF